VPSSGSSARRYAQAVFEIATERNALEKWQEDLQSVVDAVGQPELAALMRNPRLPISAKRQVLQEALPKASAEAVNLATILVLRGRLEALAQPIAAEFARRLDEVRGILRVELVTAVEMDSGQRTAVERQLAESTGKQIRMEQRVDPDILGGIVIRIGDRVVDGSVRSKLRGLRHSLEELMA